MTAAQPAKTAKPWYREPWPWILMAGPFAAMIGCFVTIYFAFTNFSNQPIQEAWSSAAWSSSRRRPAPIRNRGEHRWACDR